MLPQSLTLILILLVAIVCCGLSAELPGKAYLPPHPQQLSIAADESLLSALNGFLIFDNSEDDQNSPDSFARYAPIFVDYPGVHQLLRQQQEYALDLPFEGGVGKPRPRDYDALAKRSW